MSPGQYKDLMGYCSPNWVSDYHFTKAMAHRLLTDETPAEPAMPAQTLMLWGSASDREVLLEPAFLIEAVPDVPTGRARGGWPDMGPEASVASTSGLRRTRRNSAAPTSGSTSRTIPSATGPSSAWSCGVPTAKSR